MHLYVFIAHIFRTYSPLGKMFETYTLFPYNKQTNATHRHIDSLLYCHCHRSGNDVRAYIFAYKCHLVELVRAYSSMVLCVHFVILPT